MKLKLSKNNVKLGVKSSLCTHWSDGGKRSKRFGNNVVEICKKNTSKFKYLYSDKLPILEKVEKIAKEIYNAKGIEVDEKIKEQVKKLKRQVSGVFQFV